MMPVYPGLAGLSWPVKKTPTFKNTIITSTSGRDVALNFWQYPRYSFELVYNFLTQDDLNALLGFFLARHGDFEPFFFDAGANDNAVDRAGFGVGDGVTTTFELLRSTGGQFAEPVGGSFGERTAYVNNIATAATFSGADNTVTFDAAPAAGAALAWSGNYYYLCKFAQGDSEFDQFCADLYEAQSVQLQSVIPDALA